MSYGSRLRNFKNEAVRYITDKVKGGYCRNIPGDIKMIGERCFVVHTTGEGTVPLDTCSVERICNIADKIHFEPLGSFYPVGDKRDLKKEEPKKEVKQEPVTTQIDVMAFEIKQNVPLPGQIFTEPVKVEKKTVSKHVNYRTLPLKDMKVGECIIIHECEDAKSATSKYGSAKTSVANLVNLMDTKKKFKVAKTDDFKVGVWRID